MSVVTNPDASIALHVLDVVEARLQRAMAQAATGKSVATVSDDPTTFVIADRLGSDAQAFAAVKSSLGGAAVPTLVANAAASSISDTLLKLKQSVIEAQSGVVSGSAADSQIRSLLSQIAGSVAEATVNGVNLVAGAVAGDVQRTQIAIPRNLDGATITIGDAGLSAMNASVAGLGLDGFTATSGGLAVGFSSLVADNIGTAAPASQMQVSTANYGAAETPQYPGQSWTFVFTDAAGPAASPADSNVVVDASGNVTHVDHTIPVPLPTGFSLSEATDALQRALHDARFETSYATTGPSPTLSIAGNNIGSATVQNLRPALPIAVRPGSALLTAGVAAGASSFPIRSVVLADIPSSLAGAIFLSTQSQINAYKSSNPTAPAFYLVPLGTAIAPGTTIQSVNAATPPALPGTYVLTLSPPVTSPIPASTTLGLLLPAPIVPVVATAPWSGLDGAIATINSALRRISDIGGTLGRALNSLQTAQDHAAESVDLLNGSVGTLTDADLGKVGASILALQIQKQLATQSLAMANQSPSFLLQLFK